jgi:hypothetical protein
MAKTMSSKAAKAKRKKLKAKGKSGIVIKPQNKGSFNAIKKKTGKTTEELTHSKDPAVRKKAVFAKNAKKWKH